MDTLSTGLPEEYLDELHEKFGSIPNIKESVQSESISDDENSNKIQPSTFKRKGSTRTKKYNERKQSESIHILKSSKE